MVRNCGEDVLFKMLELRAQKEQKDSRIDRHRKPRQELRARVSQAAGSLWPQDTSGSCRGLVSRRGAI